MVLETRKKTNPNTIPNSRWVFDDPVDVVRSYTFQWMHWEKFKVYRTLAVPIRRSTIQTLLGFQDQMRSGYSGWWDDASSSPGAEIGLNELIGWQTDLKWIQTKILQTKMATRWIIAILYWQIRALEFAKFSICNVAVNTSGWNCKACRLSALLTVKYRKKCYLELNKTNTDSDVNALDHWPALIDEFPLALNQSL